jgi:hypothetical protein
MSGATLATIDGTFLKVSADDRHDHVRLACAAEAKIGMETSNTVIA